MYSYKAGTRLPVKNYKFNVLFMARKKYFQNCFQKITISKHTGYTL